MSHGLARYAEDLRTLPGDLRRAWRRDGLPGVGYEVASRSTHRIVRWHRFLLGRAPLAGLPELPPPTGVAIRPLEAHQRPLLEGLMGRRGARRNLPAPGAPCTTVVAWWEGEPVGYGISSERSLAMEGVESPGGDDGIYVTHLYVRRDSRGRGVGSALSSALVREAAARGKRFVFVLLPPGRPAAVRNALRAGGGEGEALGEVRILKVLRWSLVRYRPFPAPRPAPEVVAPTARRDAGSAGPTGPREASTGSPGRLPR